MHSLFSEIGTAQRVAVMAVNSTVLITLVLLIGAAVPSFAEEEPSKPSPVLPKRLTSASWKRRAVLGKG